MNIVCIQKLSFPWQSGGFGPTVEANLKIEKITNMPSICTMYVHMPSIRNALYLYMYVYIYIYIYIYMYSDVYGIFYVPFTEQSVTQGLIILDLGSGFLVKHCVYSRLETSGALLDLVKQ